MKSQIPDFKSQTGSGVSPGKVLIADFKFQTAVFGRAQVSERVGTPSSTRTESKQP